MAISVYENDVHLRILINAINYPLLFLQNSVESPLPPMPSTPDKVHLDPSRDVSNKLQEEDLDGLYTFKRKPYVKYYPVSRTALNCSFTVRFASSDFFTDMRTGSSSLA